MKIQQAPADKAQAYLGTVEKIVLEFDQLVHHSEVQKKQLALVYEEVIVEFEEWISETVERLESGGIVTIDIEEFQGELTVSDLMLFLALGLLYSPSWVDLMDNTFSCHKITFFP